MEGLVPATATATASTFQLILEHLCAILLLILEHLCAILLLISEGLGHVPALPVFLSVILVGALVVVSLMVKRPHMSRGVKAPDKRCPACDKVCAGCSENTGPMTGADNTSPGVEASSLWLQTLCLKALNEHLSRMSLQDLADLVRTVIKIQPPRRSHVTHEKPVTKAPGTNRDQLQENMPADLKQDTPHPNSPELCQDKMVGWKQDVQDKEEEKQGLEPSTAPVERDLQGTVGQSPSLVGNLLQTSPRPKILRGHLAQVKSQVERQGEAEIGDPSIHGSEGDLRGVPPDADLDVPLPRADEDNWATARQLWEQKQISEELAAEIRSLRTEKASLRCENIHLKAEIQQLKLKLQVRPDTQEDRLTRLHQQVLEAEVRCLEMEKEHLDSWRDMDSTYRMLNAYRKGTQDLSQDLRRSTSCYEEQVRCHQERARGARMAAEHMERKLRELRRETDRSRQVLAKAKSTLQHFPGGPSAPAAPPTAHRGPEVPGRPLGRVIRSQEGAGSRGKSSRIQGHLQM